MGTQPPFPKMGEGPQFSAHVCCGQTAVWIKMPLGTEVGLGPVDIVFDGDPAAPPQKGGGTLLPNFRPISVVAKRLDGSRCTWHGGGLWSRPHCARWGHTSLPKKRIEPPIFGPFLLWPNGWMHQDATWYEGRPQPRRLCVRFDPALSPKNGRSPQSLAHVYYGQMAAWIKMSLGMELGLGPGYFVLDGDPALLP